MPIVLLKPVRNKVQKKDGIYNCPLYKVVSRKGTLSTTGHSTNFVIFIEIPTNNIQNKYIIAGVACFLALR